MKKLLLIGCLALAGCAAAGPTGVVQPGTDRVKQVQAYAVQFCKFVPAVQTVAALLAQGSISTLADIAAGICAAVTTAPLADGGPRQAKLNGVVIRGRFVQ